MIDYIRRQIKKRRVEKGFTQSDVALDLGITAGAYSKIESGPTEISVKKLVDIAKVLEVDVTYFFPDPAHAVKTEDPIKPYGYATKTDIDQLISMINKMKQEIALLKNITTPAPKKKKK